MGFLFVTVAKSYMKKQTILLYTFYRVLKLFTYVRFLIFRWILVDCTAFLDVCIPLTVNLFLCKRQSDILVELT